MRRRLNIRDVAVILPGRFGHIVKKDGIFNQNHRLVGEEGAPCRFGEITPPLARIAGMAKCFLSGKSS
jgi:hypothetical protein